ncbi:unnamed protein product [Arctogadus glacialis]
MRGLGMGGCGWPPFVDCHSRDDEEEYYGSDPRPRSLAFEDKDPKLQLGLDAVSLASTTSSQRTPQCRICFQGPEQQVTHREGGSNAATFSWRQREQQTAERQHSVAAAAALTGSLTHGPTQRDRWTCRWVVTGQDWKGELLSPCRCDGSVRCTHQPCLIRWISERGSWSCELCYFKYQVLAISTKNPLQPRPYPHSPEARPYPHSHAPTPTALRHAPTPTATPLPPQTRPYPHSHAPTLTALRHAPTPQPRPYPHSPETRPYPHSHAPTPTDTPLPSQPRPYPHSPETRPYPTATPLPPQTHPYPHSHAPTLTANAPLYRHKIIENYIEWHKKQEPWARPSPGVIEKVQIAAIILGSLFLIASISWLIWSSLSPSAKWQRQDLLFQICYGMYGFMDIVCIGLIIHEGSSVYRIFKRWQAVNQQWKVLNYEKAKDLGDPLSSSSKAGNRAGRGNAPHGLGSGGGPGVGAGRQSRRLRTILNQHCGYTILHILSQLRPHDPRLGAAASREVVMRVTTV